MVEVMQVRNVWMVQLVSCQLSTCAAYGLHGQWVPCVQWRCRWLLCPQPSGRTESEPSAALQPLDTRAHSKRSAISTNWSQVSRKTVKRIRSKPTPHIPQIIRMAFFHFVYGAQCGLCPTDEVICVQKTGSKLEPSTIWTQAPCFTFKQSYFTLIVLFFFLFVCDLKSDLGNWCSVHAGDHPTWRQHLGWCSQLLWWYPAAAQTARPAASVWAAPPDSPAHTQIKYTMIMSYINCELLF